MLSRLFGLSTLVLGAALLATPGSARATDYCPPSYPAPTYQAPQSYYKTVVSYQNVTSYETQRVAYNEAVTCYDECGHPYTVTRVRYREVQVPVTRTVAVTRRVLVSY